MSATKFTFKTERGTGKFASFWPTQHHIKLDGSIVGEIFEKDWRVSFTVFKKDILEDGNPNCKFKTIILKFRGKDLQDCKDFVNKNFNTICSQFNLYKTT